MASRWLRVVQIGQEHGEKHGGDEKEAGTQQGDAEVADFGEEAEEDGADGGGNSADVVAEAGTGGSKEHRKQRREIHGEKAEDAGEKADPGNPEEHGDVIARFAVGAK